jgi:hypothetical protein
MSRTRAYDHTQVGKFHAILLFLAMPMGALALNLERDGVPLALGVGGLFVLGAMAFRSLRVRDGGDHLAVSFGPLPAIRRKVPYSEITAVRRVRSSIIDGWGVHWVPFRGWTWNIWGRDCAEITLGDRTLRVGTNDPDGLVGFLGKRLSAA